MNSKSRDMGQNLAMQGFLKDSDEWKELAYAHRTVLAHMPYGKTWALGGTDPGPREDDEVVIEPEIPDYRPPSNLGAIRSLPKAPADVKKEDRTLGKAMRTVYRQILYNRAIYLREILQEDDYNFSNKATCQSWEAYADIEPAPEQGQNEESDQVPPLMFNSLRFTNPDSRALPPSTPMYIDGILCKTVGYDPLPAAGSIRVLALFSGEGDDPLRGELRLLQLPNTEASEDASFPQPYEALSYVWGLSTQNQSIELSHIGDHQITDNLATALRRLRSQLNTRLLWVDAICIDQSNVEERSNQVQLMGSIYKNAARVLVWLGDAQVPRHTPNQNFLFQTEYDTTLWHGHNQLIERNPLSEEQDWQARTLAAVLAQTNLSFWWERAWIVQEFALSRFSPIACFGETELPWNELRVLVDTIFGAHVAVGWNALAALGRLNDFCRNIRDLMKMNPDEIDLFRVMYFARSAKASDPRDRLYALLSLINPDNNISIIPDYTKSCVEAFVAATARLMEADKTIYALLMVTGEHEGDESRMAGLPSWAIDFTFGDRFSKLGGTREMPLESKADLQRKRRKKSQTGENSFSFDHTNCLLKVDGLDFDGVQNIYPLPTKYNCVYPNAQFNQTLNDMQSLIEELPETVAYGRLSIGSASMTSKSNWDATESITDRDWSVLREDRKVDQYPRKNDMCDILRHLFDSWSIANGLTRKPSYQRSRLDARNAYSDMQFYGDFFNGGNVLFTTTKGFIGIAPKAVRVGDRVVAPFSCEKPILLRPAADGHFRYHGLVFVHGVMEGEVPDKAPAFLNERREFVIA